MMLNSNMADLYSAAETANPSGAPKFISSFCGDFVA